MSRGGRGGGRGGFGGSKGPGDGLNMVRLAPACLCLPLSWVTELVLTRYVLISPP